MALPQNHSHLCPRCLDDDGYGGNTRNPPQWPARWWCPITDNQCKGGLWELCPKHAIQKIKLT